MGLDLGRGSVAGFAEGDGEAFVPAVHKYTIEAPIGKGGMGEVFLVTDKDLRRQVAMKILRADIAPGRDARLHFLAEAQATSQLEHPGIPPVHDIGVAKDGRIYFTMKLVRGRTLRDIIHDLLLKRREVQVEYTLHKLITILERICETMHFSHERGVIHRDLKPENIMLGDYGEVHVMDWGLAKVEGISDHDLERVQTARTAEGNETVHGTVMGTPAYMSPEQAVGGDLDRRTDIYALGCVLYEVLTLQPAFDFSSSDTLHKVAAGEFAPVEARNPRRPVPEALAAVCRRAMSKAREERHATARDVSAELRAWLDGTSERERRHKEAEALAAKGKEAAARYERLRAQVREVEVSAEAEGGKYKSWQQVAEKRPLLAARKRVEELGREAALAFAETTQYLHAALIQEEENATARAALARLWHERLVEAEGRGDRDEAAYALTLVERYDDGKTLAKGDGSLVLSSEPPGAEVLLSRFVERDGILVAEEELPLGRTPVGPVTLAMGSYLCVLRHAEPRGGASAMLGGKRFRDVRYPVHITRGRAWRGNVRLRMGQEIGDGFVFVPGGPFLIGDGRETRTVDLRDFAIAKSPVTRAEYGEFLTALDRERGKDAAMAHMARNPSDGDYFERGEDGVYRPINRLEGPALEWSRKTHGEDFLGRLPAGSVSWDDAKAYCDWKSRATGKPWRLPTEEEREKAARGVDGRGFAWGDLEDASLGKCRESRDHEPQPEPVGVFRTAESVYGMGDASGGIWEWTDSWFDARQATRCVRSGSWFNPPSFLRCAYRYAALPRGRYPTVGFRCAKDL
jgi:serine/threonine-protein kinase